MTLDSTSTLLLGALLSLTAVLVVTLAIGVGFTAWLWSWAARFDDIGATREPSGDVLLSAKLKAKEPRKVRKLREPGNGVRRVQPRGQA